MNKLVIVGNGFDLAHGLKTSYSDFVTWYMCNSFSKFCKDGHYIDELLEIKNTYAGLKTNYKKSPSSIEEVSNLISLNNNQNLTYKSIFFQRIIDSFNQKKWVDIELSYFRALKSRFKNPTFDESTIIKLNSEFNCIISHLQHYILDINNESRLSKKLDFTRRNLKNVIFGESKPIKFLNFNYTDTLETLGYADRADIIYIHGQASRQITNPIIFGYGDESDPVYQEIEDSGKNLYLEHIKSFGYFQTDNYQKLLAYLDSAEFEVYILGHSCGLSDRVLLNEIFEHRNCNSINIFYYQKEDGSDNFKEITQEISRHFKPQNKNLMRRRVKNKDLMNTIPQSNFSI